MTSLAKLVSSGFSKSSASAKKPRAVIDPERYPMSLASTNTHAHTGKFINAHTYTHKQAHTHIHAYTHVYMCTHIHTQPHTHACMLTCTHTHIYMHNDTYSINLIVTC